MADPFTISIKDCFQGSPISFVVNFWSTAPDPDATPPIVGVPIDISGWTFFFTWKINQTDPDTKALWLKDSVIAAGAGTGGSYSFKIPSAKTAPVPAKTVTFWDLKTISGVGLDPQATLNGTIYLNPAITQRLIPNSVVLP